MDPSFDDKYDVVIVGGGAAGLFAGCFLAKKGYKCALFESHYIPGGCAQGFSRNRFYFDAGAHLIGAVNPNAVLMRTLARIGLDYPFIPVSPMDRLHFPDGTIEIPSGWQNYKQLLMAAYPSEREGIERLFAEMERIARFFARKEIQERYGSKPFSSLLDDYLTDSRLKVILSAQWGFLGEPPDEVSSISMVMTLVSYIRDGAGYAKGGMQRFCNTIANRFRKLGGRLFLSTSVDYFEVKGDRIDFIVTSKGQKITSDHYVCTAHPRYVLDHSNAPTDQIDPFLREALSVGKSSLSIYSIFLGLNMQPERLRGINGWYFQDGDINKKNSWVYVFSNTLYDSSLAPPGKSTFEAAFPYSDELSEWGFGERRQILRKKMLQFLSALVPGMESRIEVLEDGVPETFQKYTNNPGGSIYGWAPRADNYYQRQLIANTPLFANLILAGHWANPGPGIPAVAISAYLAANRIHEKSDALLST